MSPSARRRTPDTGDAGEPPIEPSLGKALVALKPYLAEFPGRLALALSLLFIAKIAGVWLPQLMKQLVDGLSTREGLVLVVPAALLLAYGAFRFLNVLLGELRELRVLGGQRRAEPVHLDLERPAPQLDRAALPAAGNAFSVTCFPSTKSLTRSFSSTMAT